MKTNFRRRLLILLVTLSLGGFTSLEPVLHNHDLDQTTHEDCISCGWTQVNLDQSSSLHGVFSFNFDTFAPKLQNYLASVQILSDFLSRAPPGFS
jgi:hypothetical protein